MLQQVSVWLYLGACALSCCFVPKAEGCEYATLHLFWIEASSGSFYAVSCLASVFKMIILVEQNDKLLRFAERTHFTLTNAFHTLP